MMMDNTQGKGKRSKVTLSLLEHWLPGLPSEELHCIIGLVNESSNELCSFDSGAIGSNDPDTEIRLISNILGALNAKKDHSLICIFAQKGEALIPLCSRMTNCHFFYMHMIKHSYKVRDDFPDALESAIAYCKKQIDISPIVASEMKSEYGRGLPTHTGYKQLAIIYEKQGEYELAIKLCEEAYIAGWGGGVTSPKSEDDWEKRIERIKAKQNKSGKVKQQKISAPKTPLDVPDDNVRVHCPNCKSILNVPKKYCGQRGKCKRCGGTLTVPTANNT
ncbi:MAG TPA: tetratricopeptide repeat protein [Candidatus Hydrogenedentes bacterium]|nr:tetratricopeptide repeat protein [Candidatus Hydrogenedentota bacterium]